jgi:hypothetical protein
MDTFFNSQFWIQILLGFFIWLSFAVCYFYLTKGIGKFTFVSFSIFYIIVFIINPVASFVIGIVSGISIFIWLGLKSRRKQKYKNTVAKFEAGGIRRGLAPPEIAAVFGKPFHQILTLIFIGLLEKGFIFIDDEKNIKLKVSYTMETRTHSLNAEKRGKLRRIGAQESKQILFPFEEPFIELLEQEEGKEIAEIDFNVTVKPFYNSVAERLGGFDLEQTREYCESLLEWIFENEKFVGPINNNRKQRIEWNLLNSYLNEKYSLELDKLPIWFLYDNHSSDKHRPNKTLVKWIYSLEDKIKSRLSQEDIRLSLDRMMNENSSEFLQEIIHSTYHM